MRLNVGKNKDKISAQEKVKNSKSALKIKSCNSQWYIPSVKILIFVGAENGEGLRLWVLEVGTLKNGVKEVSIQYTGCKNKVANIYKVKCLSLLV